MIKKATQKTTSFYGGGWHSYVGLATIFNNDNYAYGLCYLTYVGRPCCLSQRVVVDGLDYICQLMIRQWLIDRGRFNLLLLSLK